MKRSEMHNYIMNAVIAITFRDDIKYDVTLMADELLKLIEDLGMSPPEALVDDGQDGKFWNRVWEAENK